MNKIQFLLIASCWLAITFFYPVQATFAQSELGIVWNVPRNESDALKDLDEFRELGAKNLLIQQKISNELRDTLAKSPFNLYISIPINYPTAKDFSRYASEYYQEYRDYIHYYDSLSTVKAYGLFQNGDITSRKFNLNLKILNAKVHEITKKPVFFIQSSQSEMEKDTTDLSVVSIIIPQPNTDTIGIQFTDRTAGIYFKPVSSGYFNSEQLYELLTKTRRNKTVPLFLNSEWVKSVTKSHPEMVQVFKDYTHGLPVLISTRPSRHFDVSESILVLFLLILWVTIAVHYSFEPNYRKSVIRFFTTHHFFVDDVMERLTRLSNSNLIVFAIQVFIGGVFLYTVGQTAFTSTGFSALIYHYPMFGFIDHSMLTLFFLGLAATLIYNLICIAWVYFGVTDIGFPGQAITLYSWPQHVNIVLITIMITLRVSNGPAMIIYILALLYVVIVFSSFYLSVFDTTRLNKKSYIQHLKTTIPHFLIILALLFWLLSNTQIIDVIRLSANL